MEDPKKILFRNKAVDAVRTLEREGKLSSTDLWNAIKHRSTANESLDELMELGIVQRILEHDGHPRVYWTLTAEGKKWCEVLDWIERLGKRPRSRKNRAKGEM